MLRTYPALVIFLKVLKTKKKQIKGKRIISPFFLFAIYYMAHVEINTTFTS